MNETVLVVYNIGFTPCGNWMNVNPCFLRPTCIGRLNRLSQWCRK